MKAVLENSLTKEQANRLFSVIDLNRDGILQAKELHQVMSDDIKGMISLTLTSTIFLLRVASIFVTRVTTTEKPLQLDSQD